MYQFSYAEIMEDGVANAKDRERQALTKSIDLLVEARDSSSQRPTIEALFTLDGSGSASLRISSNPTTRRPWNSEPI